MEQGKVFSSGQNTTGDTWYVDNYILLKSYYDMTISRIAARCVRSGNIALEEYPHYAYILDVLEEISETGEYVLAHPDLYPYVEKKIVGGINALKTNLREYKTELERNASPEMIKEDKNELNKMKEALGSVDKTQDPTVGAGMSMDEVINKLMGGQGTPSVSSDARAAPQGQPQPRPQGQMPQPRPQGQPRTQNQPRPQGQPQPRPQGQMPQSQPRPQGQAVAGQTPRPTQGQSQPQAPSQAQPNPQPQGTQG